MSTYVNITRQEVEDWLDQFRSILNGPWKLKDGRAGVYLLPLSHNVAIKFSSTVGSADVGMSRARASAQFRLVSRITGQVLNKKAQGQRGFFRTTNWQKNWVKGVQSMRAVYLKSQGFYDALAEIEDRDAYKQDMMDQIEANPNWKSNKILMDFHQIVARGGILTSKQKDLMAKVLKTEAKETTPQPPPDPPGKPRNSWSLDGGPSGEESISFEVRGNAVYISSIDEGDEEWSRPTRHTFEQAAEIWTDMLKGPYNEYTPGNPPPFLSAASSKYSPQQQAFLNRLDALEAGVKARGDTWTVGFLEGIRGRIEKGTPLSEKQKQVLKDKMRVYRVASRYLRKTGTLVDFSTTPMSKPTAIRRLYKLVGRTTNGFFDDEYWMPVNKVFKLFSEAGVNYTIDKTEYRKNREGVPESKVWKISIDFTNPKGQTKVIYGYIVASGAGSVDDPLDRYDVSLSISASHYLRARQRSLANFKKALQATSGRGFDQAVAFYDELKIYLNAMTFKQCPAEFYRKGQVELGLKNPRWPEMAKAAIERLGKDLRGKYTSRGRLIK